MIGLFTRLAQQHIAHRSSSIAPAPSPVFPLLTGEQSVDVTDADMHQGHAPPRRIHETDAQTKNKDTVLKDSPVSKDSNSPVSNGADAKKQKENSEVTPSLTPVIESVNKAGNTQEEVRPLSTVATSSPPEAQSSIQPQIEGSQSSLTPFAPVDEKATVTSIVQELEVPPGSKPVPGRSLENHHLRPSRTVDRNVQSTEKLARQKHEETQTTINVSIGQVEIRATTPEKPEKKVSTRSNRTRSDALEEYHQKRLRGER